MKLTPGEFQEVVEGWKIREERADRRIARVCSVMANINRNVKKQSTPFSENDFMPKQKIKKTQTQDDMLSMIVAMNKAFGGTGGQ